LKTQEQIKILQAFFVSIKKICKNFTVNCFAIQYK